MDPKRILENKPERDWGLIFKKTTISNDILSAWNQQHRVSE